MSEMVDPRDITPHPKNEEIYGEVSVSDRFVDDIERKGISETLTVTDDSHFVEGLGLISGHRRQKAAIRAELDEVPVEYQNFGGEQEELEALLRANDYRQPTFRQKMGEADALLELHESGHQNFGSTVSECRATIGDRVGLGSDEQVRKAKKVWDAAKEGDELASELIEGIDAGNESVHSAYQSYTDKQASGVTTKGTQSDDESKSGTAELNREGSGEDDGPIAEIRQAVERYNDREGTSLDTNLRSLPGSVESMVKNDV